MLLDPPKPLPRVLQLRLLAQKLRALLLHHAPDLGKPRGRALLRRAKIRRGLESLTVQVGPRLVQLGSLRGRGVACLLRTGLKNPLSALVLRLQLALAGLMAGDELSPLSLQGGCLCPVRVGS